MLEGADGTLRVQASGGDVGADHAIAAVHKEVADNPCITYGNGGLKNFLSVNIVIVGNRRERFSTPIFASLRQFCRKSIGP